MHCYVENFFSVQSVLHIVAQNRAVGLSSMSAYFDILTILSICFELAYNSSNFSYYFSKFDFRKVNKAWEGTECSVQVAFLPHRLTWSAFLGHPVLLLMLLFVPKGPGD